MKLQAAGQTPPHGTSHRAIRRGTATHVAPPAHAAPPRPAGRHRPQLRGPVRRQATGREDGFTLVELLVVVLVIGALVGIAVPTFVKQRDGAWDAAVRSELRAATIALASYRAQNGTYSAAALTSGAGWGYEASQDVLTVPTILLDGQSFCLRSWYRTSADTTAAPTSTDADTRAEWAATPTGIVELTGASRACPS